MKFVDPVNDNYVATIVKIKALEKLEGLDNLVGASFFGYQALMQKDHEVGELGVLFTAETQISEEMAKQNNLHRHGNLNKDEGVSGYLEDNRRVKAIRLKGNPSNALFLPLDSLSWTGASPSDFKEGDVFDKLKGKEICQKWQIKRKEPNAASITKQIISRVDEKHMPKHISTPNYWKNIKQFKGMDNVVVTQKLHGTSIRVGNTYVNRELTIIEKLAKKLGVKVQEHEYDVIYGSKNVIKDSNNPNQNHFYSEDIYTRVGKTLNDLLPQGYVVYAEIIGYTEQGGEIQPKYTYNLPKGECALYVYRVTQVNPQGIQVDLSWEQLELFCKQVGLKHVPVLFKGKHKSFSVDKFIDTVYSTDFKNAVPLSDPATVDEGVCVRKEGLTPFVAKAKSPVFLEHETKMLDAEAVDMEEEA